MTSTATTGRAPVTGPSRTVPRGRRIRRAGAPWLLLAPALVVLAVLFSAATAYFYVRLIILMYFTEPEDEGTVVVVESEGLTSVAIGLAAIVTVALGILPGPILDFVGRAAQYLP